MNIESASQLVERYKLTKPTTKWNDPAYAIALCMVKGMDFLKAYDAVQSMFRERVFNYEGTWNDVQHTIKMYTEASE